MKDMNFGWKNELLWSLNYMTKMWLHIVLFRIDFCEVTLIQESLVPIAYNSGKVLNNLFVM